MRIDVEHQVLIMNQSINSPKIKVQESWVNDVVLDLRNVSWVHIDVDIGWTHSRDFVDISHLETVLLQNGHGVKVCTNVPSIHKEENGD